MVTALLHVDDMVILLDDEETMRLGLKIRTQEWCGQWSVKGSADIFNVRKNGSRELESNLMLMERE